MSHNWLHYRYHKNIIYSEVAKTALHSDENPEKDDDKQIENHSPRQM